MSTMHHMVCGFGVIDKCFWKLKHWVVFYWEITVLWPFFGETYFHFTLIIVKLSILWLFLVIDSILHTPTTICPQMLSLLWWRIGHLHLYPMMHYDWQPLYRTLDSAALQWICRTILLRLTKITFLYGIKCGVQHYSICDLHNSYSITHLAKDTVTTQFIKCAVNVLLANNKSDCTVIVQSL